MANYDYSIKIVGELDLSQIKEELKDKVFKIDIKLSSNAQKAINDLKKLVEDLGKTFDNIGRATVSGVTQATSATQVFYYKDPNALELARRERQRQIVISQVAQRLALGERAGAFNKVVGDIDGVKIKAEYERILKEAQALDITTGVYQKKIIELQTDITKLQAPYRILQKEAQKTLDYTDSLWAMFRKKLISAVAYRMIFTFFNTLRWAMNSLYTTTLDINTQLRDINKVLDLTQNQMVELVDTANDLAIAYGRTTLEVMQAMEYFAKAGFTYEQTIGLAELSIKLQNVGDLTANAASSFLIAANASYQLNGNLQELSKTIDIVNNLANNAAVTVDFLSEAMKVSGSVAYGVGLTMEEYAAALTTVGAATQRSGREVGNGLKTILLRLTQVTDSSGEMTNEMSKVEEVLRNVGIEIRDTPNSFRPAMEILTELAQKWESLTDIERRAITYRLAGVYRSNILEAFLSNINEYEKNLYIALNSVGSATRENELYMNSLEGALKKLTATWEEFVVKVKMSSIIQGIIKTITFYVKNLHTIVKVLAITMTGYLLKEAYIGFTKLYNTTKSLSGVFKTLGESVKKFSTSLQGVITIATIVITVIAAIADAVKRSKEEFNKAIETASNRIEKYVAEYGELNILIKQYEDLREQYLKTGEGAEELKDIRSQLIAQFGREAAGIDLVNKSYEENIRLMDELKRKNLERILQESESSAALAEEALKRSVGKYNDLAKKAPWYYEFLALIKEDDDPRKSESQIVKAIEASLGIDKSLTFGEVSDRVRTLFEEVGAEYMGAFSHDIFDAVSNMSLEQYEKLLSQVSANLTAELRGTSDVKMRNKIYSHLSYIELEQERVRNLVEKYRSIINTRLDTIRQLAEMDLASDITKLHGREASIFHFLKQFVEIPEDVSDTEALEKYQQKLKEIIDIIDGVNADNVNEVWEKLLGLGIGLTEKDRDAFLDYITNTNSALQNLISTLEESLTPFEQYIKKMEDLENVYAKIYDLRRSIADEAGFTGDDYLAFALGDTGLISQIENEELRKLAQDIQETFVKYQEDLRKAEAEGLNNQETITTLYQTQLKLKEKELKILQKQLEIDEKRRQLHALENERTQRVFINGQAVYVEDYSAVEKARQELEQLEKERTRLISERQTDEELANIEKERLLLSDSLIDLSNKIKSSTEDASNALKEFAKNINKYSKILIDGEDGIGGIRGLINQIIDLIGPLDATYAYDVLKDAIQRQNDIISRIFGGDNNSIKTPTSSSNNVNSTSPFKSVDSTSPFNNVNIGTVNVNAIGGFDQIVDELIAYTKIIR